MAVSPFVHLDRAKHEPLYRQIAEQIKQQIGEGQLPYGTRLPTVRELARMLSVTKITVQNAYGELQAGGWIESTVGRGTYVTGAARNHDLIREVGRGVTADAVMINMPRMAQIAGMVSLAYAEPDPTYFPAEDFWRSLDAQAAHAASLFQYGAAQGDEALRIELAILLEERGIYASPADIIVTTGVSQGLSLVAHCLAGPGTAVAVEQPAYLGILHILSAVGAQCVGIPLDDEGLRLDVLEAAIAQHHPRFLYTMTNFQNPTGLCTSAERRRALLEMARRHGLLIVEDDTYSQLGYDVEVPTSLKAADTDGLVIYLSGFSKILMPGLRIGFMVAPSGMNDRLLSVRQAFDLCGPGVLQRALAHFLHRGKLKSHLRRVIPHYRERRDELMRALQSHMPADVTWTRPAGGFCCWLTMPDQPGDLYQAALNRGVAFTPGETFLIAPSPQKHIRLCYGGQPPERIHEGVARLGELLRERAEGRLHRLRGTAHDLPLV